MDQHDTARIEQDVINVSEFGKVASTLVFLVFAAGIFGASVAGLLGEWPRVLSSALAIAFWGKFILLSLYASRLAFPVVKKGDTNHVDEYLTWTHNLQLLAMILSVIMVFD